jgi:iron complex outermembrane receptor protein
MCAAITIAALCCSTPGFAQVRQFDVPSEDAGRSIPEFARQANIQVVAPGDQLHGVTTPSIKGAYDVFAALDLMLEGTDLKVSRSTEGIVTISLLETKKQKEREKMSLKNSTSIFALIIGMLGGNAVAAQAQTQERVAAAPAETVETVTVTGTSIRGTAGPVGSAVLGITAETIQANAPSNAQELLSNVPQLGNFGANAEQSTPNHYRTAGFDPNIHNLGIYATLTLVNGHRIAPTGGEAVLPDPSIVPVIALQRVEVLANGASAVYGSDAVAGVVNFIYRKEFEGLQASGTYGFNDTQYAKKDFQLLGGHSWGSGNIMAAYEYSQTVSPLVSEIPFLALGGDQRSRGGRDLRSTTCLDPNVTVNGQAYGYSNGAFTTAVNKCSTNLDPQATVIPNSHRNAALITGRQELNDRVSVYTEVNYSNFQTQRWGGRPSLNLTIPSTSPYFRLPTGVAATSEQVTMSGLGLFPSGNTNQYAKFFGVTIGADIQLGGDWVGNIFGTSSITNDFDQESPELDQLAATRLAGGSTTATALNPFGGAAGNDPAVLSQINDNYYQENKSSNRLREFEAKANGTAFSLPGGDVQLAFGIDFQNLQSIEKQTAGSPGPNLITVRNDNISRDVVSGFVESEIPIIGKANALPGVQSLVLSVAGRADYYAKYGTIFNPKYGLNWVPIDGVTLKGSYGKSFAAPNIGMTSSTFTVPRPNSAINLTDITTGIRLGTINQLNPGGGNPDLKPETATSKSFGVDYAPDYVPGLHFSATYYDVEYRNTVYTPTASDVLTNAQFAQFRIINPTQAQITALLAKYPPQAPIVTGFDAIIYYNAQNIGAKQVGGFDFDSSYTYDTGAYGVLNLGVVANLQTKYDLRVVDGTPFKSRLSTSDAPDWKMRWNLGWNFDPVTLNLFANYISGYQNTSVSPVQHVDSNLTFDLSANLDLSQWLDHGVSLQGRVVNMFDKDPPFYDSSSGYFASLASPFGRQFEVTLRAQL